MTSSNYAIAVFGGGCFWCTEALFTRLKGVISVTPGYAGGNVEDPTYEQVSYSNTGHAEVIKIEYDPTEISFEELLEVFFKTHDPTTLNQQGADMGTQYRSIILYTNDEQKNTAEKVKKEIQDSAIFEKPIVTEIKPLDKFYEAENYHFQYYEKNANKPYCTFVIDPKIAKLEKLFKDKLK